MDEKIKIMGDQLDSTFRNLLKVVLKMLNWDPPNITVISAIHRALGIMYYCRNLHRIVHFTGSAETAAGKAMHQYFKVDGAGIVGIKKLISVVSREADVKSLHGPTIDQVLNDLNQLCRIFDSVTRMRFLQGLKRQGNVLTVDLSSNSDDASLQESDKSKYTAYAKQTSTSDALKASVKEDIPEIFAENASGRPDNVFKIADPAGITNVDVFNNDNDGTFENKKGLLSKGSTKPVSKGGSATSVSKGGSATSVCKGGSATSVCKGGSATSVCKGGSAKPVSTGGSAKPVAKGSAEPIIDGSAEPVSKGFAKSVSKDSAEPVSKGSVKPVLGRYCQEY